MKRALDLAALGRYTVSPNPMVGAVIVRDGVNVGEGFHHRAGEAHAEINALRAASEKAQGADIYVTLEPCCVHGRTPPCTEAVIAAGIKRVFVGATDPNPDVCGKGINALREAGLDVVEGLLSEEATWLNRAFNTWITTKRPWVTLKLAVTLDGKTAASTGASQWITSKAMREHVHRMRAASDAIMVGSGTALKDDPRLDVRDVEPLFDGGVYNHPLKVVVASRGGLKPNARMLANGSTLLATTHEAADDLTYPTSTGVQVVSLDSSSEGVDLDALINVLGARENTPITSIFLEGGPTLAASFIQQGLVDELRLHMAPKLMGGDGLSALGTLGVLDPAQCPQLKIVETSVIGSDIEIVATFR